MAAKNDGEARLFDGQSDFQVEIDEDFRPVLKELRGIRKVSQTKLADETGFDHSYISRLERVDGNREPSKDAIERFVVALNLEVTQADRLRASAGYKGVMNTIAHFERELLAANSVLMNPDVNKEHKDWLRANISAALGAVAAMHSVEVDN